MEMWSIHIMTNVKCNNNANNNNVLVKLILFNIYILINVTLELILQLIRVFWKMKLSGIWQTGTT